MAEPEMAAKNIQASVVTIPSPPVIHPSSVSQKLTIRLATPPLLIRFPASMKNGMAIRGKESTPVMAFCVIRAQRRIGKQHQRNKRSHADGVADGNR